MIEGEGIFVDLKNLRRVVKKAQFLMEKADRIVYGTPLLEMITLALESFEMAYDFPDDRQHYARELKARCMVIRLDVEDIFEVNALKGKDAITGRSADSVKLEIAELTGRIDKGVCRYVNSVFKGKTTVIG